MNILEIVVRPVGSSEEARYQELMQEHHYLRALPKIGETIWYVATWRDQWTAIGYPPKFVVTDPMAASSWQYWRNRWGKFIVAFGTHGKVKNIADHDPLPQINLALLFGEQSNLPFYYRKLPGNIHDVKTVTNLLADMKTFGISKANLVMDRGFYSEKNINTLYKNHLKFLIATKKNLKFVKNEIEKLKDNIRSWSNYNSDYDLYAKSSSIKWKYSQQRPNKGDILSGERRMYLHIYYNAAQAVDDERKFHKMLRTLHEELESGKRNPNNEKKYEKYFTIKTTPIRGIQVIAKDDAIEKAKQSYGYFVLLSNVVKDPIKALEIYRNKDLVEKAFCDLKDRLGFNRPAVSSDMSLDGKLFVEFIALIYLSYIKKQMKDGRLFKKYTMQSLLDEFDIIECYEQPGRALRVAEMTKNQTDLYRDMGVEPPSSL